MFFKNLPSSWLSCQDPLYLLKSILPFTVQPKKVQTGNDSLIIYQQHQISEKYDECARSLTVLLKCMCMCVCVCTYTPLWLYPDIWANFSQNHTCYFLRGGQQLKTCTEGQPKTSTCTPEPPCRGIPGREDKQPFFKSQPFNFCESHSL